MKLNDLKKIIKEEIAKVLSEAGTETAPAKPTTKPGTGKPNPFKRPDDAPKTRPKAGTPETKDKDEKKTKKEKTNEVSRGVADIVKKYKSLKGK
jgi:hypothetical protein